MKACGSPDLEAQYECSLGWHAAEIRCRNVLGLIYGGEHV